MSMQQFEGKAPGNALAPVGNDLAGFASYMERKKSEMAKICASHMDPERLFRVVMNCVTRTPDLRKCTTASIFRSVMQAVELGLWPGSALGEAYLVPFYDSKNRCHNCQLVPGYRGLVTLARRSGEVGMIWAENVYAGDKCEITYGTDPKIVHEPAFIDMDPAKIIFTYACAKFKDGTVQFAVLPRVEVNRISGAAAAKFGPWVGHFGEMAKKTAVKRLCKMLPMSVEMSKAVKLDNAVETGDYSDVEFDVVDAMPSEEQIAGSEQATQETAQPTKGTAATKEKLAAQKAAKSESAPAAPTPEVVAEPVTDEEPCPVPGCPQGEACGHSPEEQHSAMEAHAKGSATLDMDVPAQGNLGAFE